MSKSRKHNIQNVYRLITPRPHDNQVSLKNYKFLCMPSTQQTSNTNIPSCYHANSTQQQSQKMQSGTNEFYFKRLFFPGSR